MKLRRALALAFPAGLVALIYAVVGRLGFNPTDEGVVAAHAHRILEGQVPHRDIVSSHPLGSGLLHTVDFAVPLPLFPVGRVLSIAETVAYTVLFAVLVFGRSPARFAPWQAGLTAIAVLVNLHAFPFMSWYTQDGLLLCAVGAVLVLRDGSGRARRIAGLLLLGAAVTTKQSFVLVPLAVVGVLAASAPPGGRLRAAASAAGVAALPGLAYGAWVTLAGGGGDLIDQLFGARRPNDELFELRLGSIGALTVALVWLAARARRESDAWRALRLAGAVLGAGWIAAVVLGNGLERNGTWGILLWQALLVMVVMRLWVERRVDVAAVLILVTAWAAALSYGTPVPNLVAGSIAVCLLDRLLTRAGAAGFAPSRPALRRGAMAGVWAVLVATAVVFVHARRDSPYEDRPASELTADLGAIAADFGGIRTNPVTARYVEQVRRCTRIYPARQVAILPDNAALYLAFDLDNPFPIDFMWPFDYLGARDRLLREAIALDRRGDYLVLLQTVGGYDLPGRRRLPRAAAVRRPRVYDQPLEDAMIRALHGRQIACGSLLGIYEPRPRSAA